MQIFISKSFIYVYDFQSPPATAKKNTDEKICKNCHYYIY